MSYLTLPKGIPNFSKAVISLWFRVPQESVSAVKDKELDVFGRTIPLLTFGDGLTIEDWEPSYTDVAVAINFPQEQCPPILSPAPYTMIGMIPVPPCHIGLAARGNGSNPVLIFYLQTEQHASGLSNTVLTRMDVYSLGTLPPPTDVGNPAIPGNNWNSIDANYRGFAAAFEDWPQPLLQQPEYFLVMSPQEIIPDRWHHLLLSFDLSDGCSTQQREDVDEPGTIADATSAYCKLWYAIDDVNYDGEDNLGPYAVGSGNTNGILSANAWKTADSFHRLSYNTVVPAVTCSFAPAVITSSNHAIGLPASAQYVNDIYRVEMAEFQLFTGITADTGNANNRRAFVDVNGKPVPPDKKKDPDDPKSGSIELLGKEPEILLHGSSNWKTGKNTGTTGIEINSDGEQTIIPAGQFTPTGGIEPWKPDPTLET